MGRGMEKREVGETGTRVTRFTGVPVVSKMLNVIRGGYVFICNFTCGFKFGRGVESD